LDRVHMNRFQKGKAIGLNLVVDWGRGAGKTAARTEIKGLAVH